MSACWGLVTPDRGWSVASRRVGAVVLATALALAGSIAAPAARQTALAAEWPAYCIHRESALERADELLASRYRLDPHPIVTLPVNLRWTENPLNDRNWQYQLHTLRFTLDLLRAWTLTGRAAYRDRAVAVQRDWFADNPRGDPPSTWSWNDHGTAWRAITLACTADLLPMTDWLRSALVAHGRALADPDFYVHHGNHALNQAIGLLEMGRVLGRADWRSLARDRINALVLESVDSQGVSNEGALGYQVYNYNRYVAARERLRAAGLAPGSRFARVDLMPRMMAQGSLPDGTLEMIGDTALRSVPSYPGTPTEYVASKGTVGTAPPLVSVYSAGYLFARTGWGARRAFADETFLSARWGPGRRQHGHDDGASITLYGWGSRLLVDPGKYTYNESSWRTFFTGRRSANAVTVDGLTWNSDARTSILSKSIGDGFVDVRLRPYGYAGVTHVRRVTFSRRLDYVLVEDRLSSSVPRTYRQLWHLTEDADPVLGGATVWTTRDRGNVMIRQLYGTATLRIVEGSTSPVQGWISYRFNTKVKAPVVQAVRTGTTVRYLTLIVPAETTPHAATSDLTLTSTGYRVTVTLNGRSERVVADGSSVAVTALDWSRTRIRR